MNYQHVGSLLLLLVVTTLVYAHPGGRNAEGCHTCRSKCDQYGLKDGERHCHKPTVKKADKPPTVAAPVSAEKKETSVLRVDYVGGYTIWLDCTRRGAVKFRYNAQRDTGSHKRRSNFYLDPDVPERCQQTSTKSYKRRKGARVKFDRGHLVPANHLDSSATAIRESNYMTNILPQTATMNRGAWRHTEDIIECYRDIDELLVLGGPIWEPNLKNNDYFIKSHGVRTPDQFWKVVIRNDRVIAWVIPNDTKAKYKNLDDYLVSVQEIERVTGETIPVDDFRKDEVLQTSWQIPVGCDRG